MRALEKSSLSGASQLHLFEEARRASSSAPSCSELEIRIATKLTGAIKANTSTAKTTLAPNLLRGHPSLSRAGVHRCCGPSGAQCQQGAVLVSGRTIVTPSQARAEAHNVSGSPRCADGAFP